jgi:hypothetical protein
VYNFEAVCGRGKCYELPYEEIPQNLNSVYHYIKHLLVEKDEGKGFTGTSEIGDEPIMNDEMYIVVEYENIYGRNSISAPGPYEIEDRPVDIKIDGPIITIASAT